MITVSQIRLPLSADKREAIDSAIKLLNIPKEAVKSANISKISVDARRKTPTLVYSVAVFLHSENIEHTLKNKAPNVRVTKQEGFSVVTGNTPLKSRPVICGFGPAGIFCALLLARAGFKPVVFERGSAVENRIKHVEEFEKNGALNEQSNIQFGEGGAGTFSDGKLTTRIKSPLCKYVTDTLIKHGAPQDIAYKHKPHIGTDILRDVIVSIRKEIIELGGSVFFDEQITGIRQKNGRVTHIITQSGETPCDVLVMCIGHSARDTFKMLGDNGVALEVKPFSVGFRAEHLQSHIDTALYGDAAGHPALSVGEYQMSHHVSGGRCVYTFCMCPGGSVVAAASSSGSVVTNGMSYHARSGKNANAAVVVSLNANDFNTGPFEAIAFQERLEKSAFLAGGGNYRAPAQSAHGFIKGESILNVNSVVPSYSLGTAEYDLGRLFPKELTSSLRQGLLAFDRNISGFAGVGAVLTGVETRTSSPVRMARKDDGQSTDINGMYPCGEGAGYAGGIMSAATDGLNTALKIVQSFKPAFYNSGALF